MAETEDEAGPASTAFDAIVERMKKDLNAEEGAQASPAHVSQLRAIFDAALHEMGAMGENAADRLHNETEKLKTQMSAHPAVTVSSAFAAGYFVGKAIAGKVRK